MDGLALSLLVIISATVMQVLLLVPGVVAGVRPPAMYVFGDSTLDVGNNNYLPGQDVPRADEPHYGVDFPGVPTGRFSNGYNTADYVARSMGFVSSPPPYLSLLAPSSSWNSSSLLVLTALTTGVSYASAGAGILDSTNAGNNIPLSRQVQQFKATKAKIMASTMGSRAVNALLSRSVFLIGVGSNDMFVFSTAQVQQSQSQSQSQSQNKSPSAPDPEQQSDVVAAFYASLISNYSAAITELYSLGARRFAIINVGMVGCVPQVRALDATSGGACSGELNSLAAGFNAELTSLMSTLAAGAAARPGLVYSLADSFALTQATFADPQASGYTEVAGACCGSGRLRAEEDCVPGGELCAAADRGGYLFWDRVHPSQRAALLTAKAFYDGSAQFTKPISFKQLLAHHHKI